MLVLFLFHRQNHNSQKLYELKPGKSVFFLLRNSYVGTIYAIFQNKYVIIRKKKYFFYRCETETMNFLGVTPLMRSSQEIFNSDQSIHTQSNTEKANVFTNNKYNFLRI